MIILQLPQIMRRTKISVRPALAVNVAAACGALQQAGKAFSKEEEEQAILIRQIPTCRKNKIILYSQQSRGHKEPRQTDHMSLRL